jgi:integrase/recombinase XerC
MEGITPTRLSPEWDSWWQSYLRHLRAENRSPHTIAAYTWSAEALVGFCRRHHFPLDPLLIQRQHLEQYISYELERNSPSTARTRFVALRAFYSWLIAEDELTVSPMTKMHTPKVPDRPPAAIAESEVTRLLKVAEGKDFLSRRDTAIIRLLFDSGLRRAEVANLMTADIDLGNGSINVTIKGGDKAVAFMGNKTIAAMDRYDRLRRQHKRRDLPHYWLAPKGHLTSSGLYQMLQERGEAAGIEHSVRPHSFRHGFAHALKSNGASDEDVMRLGRWRDPSVMVRYGRVMADQRARETHRRLSPGDRV